jgi:hypothetical protein
MHQHCWTLYETLFHCAHVLRQLEDGADLEQFMQKLDPILQRMLKARATRKAKALCSVSGFKFFDKELHKNMKDYEEKGDFCQTGAKSYIKDQASAVTQCFGDILVMLDEQPEKVVDMLENLGKNTDFLSNQVRQKINFSLAIFLNYGEQEKQARKNLRQEIDQWRQYFTVAGEEEKEARILDTPALVTTKA